MLCIFVRSSREPVDPSFRPIPSLRLRAPASIPIQPCQTSHCLFPFILIPFVDVSRKITLIISKSFLVGERLELCDLFFEFGDLPVLVGLSRRWCGVCLRRCDAGGERAASSTSLHNLDNPDTF